ncbi:hypothetical protein [Candidatus Marinarcus aquaticus]|uniref:Uncharacterized protein n=1 Tax=Candidatus Marinarcus aquaticus TaxID=2044504 RepID=A0A4Q0XRA8_9BACT|nr:hypothetical protein [Candidatus Marinarcus aquaticus]RXJ59997.1 hypothetical protein CRV04_02990 [Candidatus Marinarcus aquaticus]
MTNVVIASNDEVCQSAKNWFVNSQGYLEGFENFSELSEDSKLIIIGHDEELGDGDELLALLQEQDFPMVDFEVILIVCSAHSLKCTKDIITPAEKIANSLRRVVWAATDTVYGQWDQDGAHFSGTYIAVEPDSDILSKFRQMTL